MNLVAGNLYREYPENIQIDPELIGRVEPTEIESLAADIEKNGQSTPAICRKNDAGKLVLVFGQRRYIAVQLLNSRKAAGEQKVKLTFKYEPLSEQQALIMAISENRFRKDVTAVDDAHNIGVLQRKLGLSVEDIAGIYFPEKKEGAAKADALRWVKERVSLQELAPEAADAVRKGEVKVTAAVQLSKLPKDTQRKVLAENRSDSKGKLKGKARLKVSAVKAAKKPAKGETKPAASKASATKVPSSVYEAAENLARAVDVWLEDATDADKKEKAIVTAHKAYRKLVPLRNKKAA